MHGAFRPNHILPFFRTGKNEPLAISGSLHFTFRAAGAYSIENDRVIFIKAKACGLTFYPPTQPLRAAIFGDQMTAYLKSVIHIRRTLEVLRILGAQLRAALRAAASQYLTAVRGTHTLAEAVLLGTLTLLGLISSLHLSCTSLLQ